MSAKVIYLASNLLLQPFLFLEFILLPLLISESKNIPVRLSSFLFFFINFGEFVLMEFKISFQCIIFSNSVAGPNCILKRNFSVDFSKQHGLFDQAKVEDWNNSITTKIFKKLTFDVDNINKALRRRRRKKKALLICHSIKF